MCLKNKHYINCIPDINDIWQALYHYQRFEKIKYKYNLSTLSYFEYSMYLTEIFT